QSERRGGAVVGRWRSGEDVERTAEAWLSTAGREDLDGTGSRSCSLAYDDGGFPSRGRAATPQQRHPTAHAGGVGPPQVLSARLHARRGGRAAPREGATRATGRGCSGAPGPARRGAHLRDAAGGGGGGGGGQTLMSQRG